jgi:Holliday junction resolvasome RuvABC DNA-binding subunit
MQNIITALKALESKGNVNALKHDRPMMLSLKQLGFADAQIADALNRLTNI